MVLSLICLFRAKPLTFTLLRRTLLHIFILRQSSFFLAKLRSFPIVIIREFNLYICVCVCVCVWERERESVYVCVLKGNQKMKNSRNKLGTAISAHMIQKLFTLFTLINLKFPCSQMEIAPNLVPLHHQPHRHSKTM